MKRLASSLAARLSMAGAIASVMLFAFPLLAQDSRLSLADRVARLEQQAQNKDQGGIGMVNQIQQLQAQVQQLQGQIEELQHHLQDVDDKSKARYTDVDSRLGRLEGSNAGGANAATANAQIAPQTNAAAAAAVAADRDSADRTGTDRNANGADRNGADRNSAPDRPTAAGSGTADAAVAGAAYDVAFKAIRGGDYVQASRDFRNFIQQYPNNALTPNAYYWLGESYYATMNYPVALEAFKHLLSQFPQSEKAPDALLKVGYCQFELKQVAQARTTLTLVGTQYPGSKAASLAQERLHQIQLQPAN